MDPVNIRNYPNWIFHASSVLSFKKQDTTNAQRISLYCESATAEAEVLPFLGCACNCMYTAYRSAAKKSGEVQYREGSRSGQEM